MTQTTSEQTSEPALSHSQLFTVRVWQEDTGEGRSEWRGQVRHVLSGETRYFRDWQSLASFIVGRAAPADSATEAEPK